MTSTDEKSRRRLDPILLPTFDICLDSRLMNVFCQFLQKLNHVQIQLGGVFHQFAIL